MDTHPQPGLRIGELARRVGVSPHVLRVWERRYGLRPARSVGGQRLYSPTDEQRIRAVAELRRQGVPAAEAVARLLRATEDFDELEGQRVLDALLDQRPLAEVVGRVVLPFLEVLGDRWEEGTMSVAQEHFASGLVRRRLSALSLGPAGGRGPVAVLACPPGELHDIALLAFGLLLARQGWQVRFLGADTPLLDLARAARTVGADVVILAATRVTALEAHTTGLRHLSRHHRLLLAGRGAGEPLAREVGAELLPEDPVTAAAALGEPVGAGSSGDSEAAGA